MKKLLLLLLILPFFAACNSNDENQSDSLDGTTWVFSEMNGNEIAYESTLRFQQEEYIYLGFEMIGSDKQEFSGSGTYTYNAPTLTMIQGDQIITATIDGNRMTIEGKDDVVYIKQ